MAVTIELRIDGLAGPRLDTRTGFAFAADTAQDPWWTLDEPLSGRASLELSALGLSGRSKWLYDRRVRVASASGAAPGSGGGTTTTVVPAAGPTVLDLENTAATAATGDQSFSDWAQATRQSVSAVTALPASLSGYRCLVLDLNQSFAQNDENELAGFLDAGGTVLALGERSDGGGVYDQADSAINGLLSSFGGGLSLNAVAIDQGDTSTTNLYPSPITAGVTSFGYNWATTVKLTGASVPLVATADGAATLVGGTAIGKGMLVVSGDSNAFSDNNDGFYTDYGNGQFVKNLCP